MFSYWLVIISAPIIAIVSVLITVLTLIKFSRLQMKLEESIVLVPLHKSNRVFVLPLILLLLATVGSIYLCILATNTMEIVAYSSVVTVSACAVVLTIAMIRFRIAVTELGVLVPFRFIMWTHLHDYEIDTDRVFFTANKYGQPSLVATTPMMIFAGSDREKLEQLLRINVK